MTNNKKDIEEDPYKEIRRDIPPPDFPFGKKGKHDKNKIRKSKNKIIKEGQEEGA